ncbi:MAG: DUF721 domain-containing protein [Myxococcales bacterium]|nr:DUF721 domain-containing protein [Myxococcales bacterium]
MTRRRKGKLEPVAQLLRRVYPAPDQLQAAKVFAWWSRSVPPRILEHARPVRFSRGVLIVNVSSSVWANELHYLTDDLLARLRTAAPAGGVEKIRFQVGPLPDIPKREAPAPPPPTPVRLASLPEDLGRALGRVHDDDLRRAITEAATMSLARGRKPKD